MIEEAIGHSFCTVKLRYLNASKHLDCLVAPLGKGAQIMLLPPFVGVIWMFLFDRSLRLHLTRSKDHSILPLGVELMLHRSFPYDQFEYCLKSLSNYQELAAESMLFSVSIFACPVS